MLSWFLWLKVRLSQWRNPKMKTGVLDRRDAFLQVVITFYVLRLPCLSREQAFVSQDIPENSIYTPVNYPRLPKIGNYARAFCKNNAHKHTHIQHHVKPYQSQTIHHKPKRKWLNKNCFLTSLANTSGHSLKWVLTQSVSMEPYGFKNAISNII